MVHFAQIWKSLKTSRSTKIAGFGLVLGCGAVYYELRTLKALFDALIPDKILRKAHQPEYIFVPEPDILSDLSGTQLLSRSSVKHVQQLMKGPKAATQSCLNPWQCLQLAEKSTDSHTRLKSIQKLAKWQLSDGERQELAQRLSLPIAVGLARTPDADSRLFLPPPPTHLKHETVEEGLFHVLMKLPHPTDKSCLRHFRELAQKHGVALYHEDYGDYSHWRQKLKSLYKEKAYKKLSHALLDALVLHSNDFKDAAVLVREGMVPLLVTLLSTREDLHPRIAAILANLTQFEQFHQHLFQAGCLHFFTQWLHSTSVSLNLQASRALYNMDPSEKPSVLSSGVFLYEPQLKQLREPKVDVVFVHGLLGGASWTWRQADAAKGSVGVEEEAKTKVDYSKCWPKDWLAKDVSDLRILGLNYSTILTHWSTSCPSEEDLKSLEARGHQFLMKLAKLGLGDKPIVWVTHSMGGLVVKHLLTRACHSEEAKFRKIWDSTRGIVFLSVPHKGSNIASLRKLSKIVFMPSREVRELEYGSDDLNKLHSEFLKVVQNRPVEIVNFLETLPTPVKSMKLSLVFVPQESGDPGVGEVHHISGNHLDICKPLSKQSFVYQRIVKLLKSVSEVSASSSHT